jgi:superfamily II DNA helicase RecQ
VLVNDATLQLLVEMRPADMQDLSSVSGFGAAALQHFAQPLLQVRLPARIVVMSTQLA